MSYVWDEQRPVSVREVHEHLAASRQLAYTTVMTVLSRLHAKGVLRRSERGRAFLYEAVNSRADHTAELMAQALADSGEPDAALTHFVDRIAPERQAALREALQHRRHR